MNDLQRQRALMVEQSFDALITHCPKVRKVAMEERRNYLTGLRQLDGKGERVIDTYIGLYSGTVDDLVEIARPKVDQPRVRCYTE